MADDAPEMPAPIYFDPAAYAQSMSEIAAAQQAAYVDGQKQLYKFQFKRAQSDTPILGDIRRTEEGKDRQSYIDFLSASGPEAQAAYLASNPAMAQSLGQINAMADATRATPEITALLDQQALEGLRTGGALTPEEQRMAEQQARAAFSARGMVMNDSAALAEVLNRQSMQDARLREDQAFAASREAGNRQFVQSATQINDATSAAMKILGMPTGSAQGMANTLGFIQGVRTPDPGPLMGQTMQTQADYDMTNYNAQMSIYNSYQNNQAAIQAAQMQAGAMTSAGNSAMMGSMMGAGGAAIGGIAMGVGVAF